jgi:hypothetical protein
VLGGEGAVRATQQQGGAHAKELSGESNRGPQPAVEIRGEAGFAHELVKSRGAPLAPMLEDLAFAELTRQSPHGQSHHEEHQEEHQVFAVLRKEAQERRDEQEIPQHGTAGRDEEHGTSSELQASDHDEQQIEKRDGRVTGQRLERQRDGGD